MYQCLVFSVWCGGDVVGGVGTYLVLEGWEVESRSGSPNGKDIPHLKAVLQNDVINLLFRDSNPMGFVSLNAARAVAWFLVMSGLVRP